VLGEIATVHKCVLSSNRSRDLSSLAGEALTHDEFQIWSLVAGGWSEAQIADLLFLTPLAVKYHLTNAITKLGVAYSHEAALLA